MRRWLTIIGLSLGIAACSTPAEPALPQFAGVISDVTHDQIFRVVAAGEERAFSVSARTSIVRRDGEASTFESLVPGQAVTVSYLPGVVLIPLDQAITVTVE